MTLPRRQKGQMLHIHHHRQNHEDRITKTFYRRQCAKMAAPPPLMSLSSVTSVLLPQETESTSPSLEHGLGL